MIELTVESLLIAFVITQLADSAGRKAASKTNKNNTMAGMLSMI